MRIRFVVSKRLNMEQCFAAAEAFDECVQHLGMDWTDNPLEKKYGNWLARKLHEKCEELKLQGAKLKMKGKGNE